MSYNTLSSYSKNTLHREDEQDYSVSKCYGNFSSSSKRNSCESSINLNNYKEDYSGISLRGSIRSPYSSCYGNPDCKQKTFTGVN